MIKGENIYKRKDGRWEGRYPKARKMDGSIYYGYIYARSYRDVKEQLIEKKARINYLSTANIKEFQGSVAEWAAIWIEDIMFPKVKASTYASYCSKIQLHLIPVLGHRPLKKVTVVEIDQLVSLLMKDLAPSSVHIVFRIVKSCFEAAKERGYLFLNPCERTVLPKINKRKINALSRSQQKAVEKECLKSSKGLPIVLALETGMRIGEICALKWEDIDFSASLLTVQRTKQRVSNPNTTGNRTKLIETSPKTKAAERIIPLTSKIKELLIQEKEQTLSPYVISNGMQPVEPRTVSYRFERIKQFLGLINIPFHSLRHTFATRCVELGANIAAVSSMLGHSSIKMTLDTYTNSFLEDQREIVKKLARI
ncbi:hypothetical protein ATZ33_16925 [Enterococcus silesiacus]|uniref:Integrase n=1 Tax=Enterococcus silesiacus TaxID=332949 RepID=A0A0S3KFE0_9ENTE|nr:site-specific integrase [Enterococcus silesiacus]ALS03000.1 hypothetical protein ATZ33_16925 [Enterococcus silesiacus]OJG92942.1 hypothetical protein RV15_GL002076 [Enterococcus silesiacus]